MEASAKFLVALFVLLIEIISTNGANLKPTFTSYNVTVTHDENIAGGTSLVSVTSSDADGVTPTFSYTYDQGEDMFRITEVETTPGTRTATIYLTELETFDYENTPNYKYTITVTSFDGTDNSDKPCTVTIRVGNVLEPPYLSPNVTSETFVTNEGFKGDSIGTPSFTVVDPDGNPSFSWAIVGGTGQDYMVINSDNGALTLDAEYDRDNSTFVEDVYVNVTITDAGGQTVEVTYFVTFRDINDKTPVFNPTAYSFTYYDNATQIGDVMTEVTVSDADATVPNNVVTLSLVDENSNTPFSDYFKLNGTQVIYQNDIDLVFDASTKRFFVVAVDGGSPSLTATAVVSFTIPSATSLASTTTIQPPQVTEDPNSLDLTTIGNEGLTIGLMLLACFLAAVVVGYLLVLCWCWNTYGQCFPQQCGRGNNQDGSRTHILGEGKPVPMGETYPITQFNVEKKELPLLY